MVCLLHELFISAIFAVSEADSSYLSFEREKPESIRSRFIMPCNPAPNCTGWPNNCTAAQPDPDIAGIGVIISFLLTALITVAASVLGYLIRDPSYEANFPSLDPRVSTSQNLTATSSARERDRDLPNPTACSELSRPSGGDKWSEILDRLILNLSDQQLATSLAILLTAFIRSCEISNYHLNMVCDLAWFSAIMHLLSVIVLRVYWAQKSKKILLHVRVTLMIAVVIMLAVALFWSPQYDPNPGNGACPAYCEFIMPVDESIFGEFEFPVQHNPLNFAGIVQTVLLVWGYSTTGAFVWPWWRRFWQLLMWRIPGYILVVPRILTRIGLEMEWNRRAPYRYTERVIDFFANAWRILFFPSQRVAILAQVISCCFGVAFLGLDRLGARNSVSEPWVENQWGFGQLLATIIVFLPALPLLELWSESKTQRQNRRVERPPCPSIGNIQVPMVPIEPESMTIARPPHIADGN